MESKFTAKLSHIPRHCVKIKMTQTGTERQGLLFCRKALAPGIPGRAGALAAGGGLWESPAGRGARGEFRAVARETRRSQQSHTAHVRSALFSHLGFPCVRGRACAIPSPPKGLGESSTAPTPTRSGETGSNQSGTPGEGGGGGLPSGSSPCSRPRGRHGNRAGAADKALGKPGRCAHAPHGPVFPPQRWDAAEALGDKGTRAVM